MIDTGHRRLPRRSAEPGRIRRNRRSILERFREWDGDKPLTGIRRRDIVERLDKQLPSSRRSWLVALRGLMQSAVESDLLGEDPTAGIEGYKAPRKALDDDREDGHQMWSEEWIEQYERHHPIGSRGW
jgi:hypothetical protein